jgi:hypothetical protein
MSILSTYTVNLPNGSQGSLLDFYTAVMDGSVETSDAGYILPDGSVLPTKGEAIYGPSEDELIALMYPYLYQEPSPTRDVPKEQRDEIVDDLSTDSPPPKKSNTTLKVLALIVVVMLLRDNKGLKV